MTNPVGRLDGRAKLVGIAVVIGIALAGMWQQTAATQAELRERVTAVEAVIPLIQDDVRTIKTDVKTILTRLPK